MIASFRSQTSAATLRPRLHPLRRAGSIGFLALLGFVVACGSSSSKPADGAVGAADSGSGGSGTGGSATTTDGGTDARRGTGGAGGATTAAATLGKVCTSDFDCSAAFVCLKASGNDFYDLAGPPHGYCSIPCSGAADQKCSSIGGMCIDLSANQDGTTSFCFQTCTLGDAPENKCQNRTDIGCGPIDPTSATSTDGFCQPTCSSNSECPAGRNCEYGLCVPMGTLVPRDPIGKHCDPPSAAMDTCAGSTACLSDPATSGTKNFCTELCVYGSATACNIADQSTALSTGGHGVCLASSASSNFGDVGFCFQQCDAPTDCLDQTDTGLICDMTVVGLPHGFCSWN
jgi:hypothetical protein